MEEMRFLDVHPEATRIPSIPGQTILGDRGENLSSVLHASCYDPTKKAALTEWLKELTPMDVADFDFVSGADGKILVVLIEASGRRISAYSASDGTLKFLALLAAMLGPNPPRFIFIEELEAGIHPARLGLLVNLIETETAKGKTQVVVTTHSPDLLAMLSDGAREHASLVYRLPGEQEGRIKRVMDIPHIREALEKEDLGRLHAYGWMETAVHFAEGGADPP